MAGTEALVYLLSNPLLCARGIAYGSQFCCGRFLAAVEKMSYYLEDWAAIIQFTARVFNIGGGLVCRTAAR